MFDAERKKVIYASELILQLSKGAYEVKRIIEMAISRNTYLEVEVFWILDSITENKISADIDILRL